ncbi:hypothetical protein [uncultured Croceitalea sp.]|uniref:hypothetical protein n=1 Tax=uncultured Croceitalea sp. TaxID=1798908 RepID=UPI0033068AB0
MKFNTNFFLILLFMVFFASAQNVLEKQAGTSVNAVDGEKIYLQVNTVYDTSETIWFKAIVCNAFFHTPTSKSSVLHVELIDPLEQRIVDSKLLKIENGISKGFFQLHSNYREGKYIIRAYTEWNRNFDTDFIFSKEITIYKFQRLETKPNPIRDIVFSKDFKNKIFSVSAQIFPLELDSLHKGKFVVYLDWKNGKDSVEIKPRKDNGTSVVYNISSDIQMISYRLKTQNKTFTKSVILDDEYGTLQFFPEGGSLMNGLESVLGIKYLDYRGKGSQVKGIIVDDFDIKVADFESNKLGMGKIIFRPEKGKTYFGKLKTKSGNTLKYKLPKANAQGMVLRVRQTISYAELSLRSTSSVEDSVFLKIYHRGKDMFLVKAKLKKGEFIHRVKNKKLPYGIIGVTAYDKDFKPICERQFFNNIPNENIEILVSTDRSSYMPRDSVSVEIGTKKEGFPVVASLSLMAIDADYFESTNQNRSTIISYLMLQSDIRGEIENPSYYFKNSKNLAQLDNLMLTQGWSNYKYDSPKKPRYIQAENGLEVTGTVGGIQNMKKRKKSKNNIYSINMLMLGNSLEVYNYEIDSTGYFKFKIKDSYGNGQKYVIQPSDNQDKSKNFKVNIKRREVPEITYKIDKVIVPVDSIVEKKMTEKITDNMRRDPFLLPNTIALNEVEVSDYKLTPKRAEMFKLHGLPDVVIDSKELLKKEKNWTGSLYPWLLFNYPHEIRIDWRAGVGGFQIAKVYGAGFTYILIDGKPVKIYNYILIPNIPLHVAESVEILRSVAGANNKYFNDVFGRYCLECPEFPAILAIYTYSGKGLFGAFPKKTNLLKETAPQYSPIREFYVPEYNNPAIIDWNIPDIRTLLHWEPNLITNIDGKAKLTFFNSDTTGKMIIICEGITNNGNVGYTEIVYDVLE